MQSLHHSRSYIALPVTQKQPPFLARQLQNPLQLPARDISPENVLRNRQKHSLIVLVASNQKPWSDELSTMVASSPIFIHKPRHQQVTNLQIDIVQLLNNG